VKARNLTKFSDLGLAAPLLQVLAAEGYDTPTPIQAQAIPSIMAGRDLLGIAQTGTGKTAAFALPIIDHLIRNKMPAPRFGARVLVLSPTRELATQIADSFRTYSKGQNLAIHAVFGGMPHGPQIRALSRGLDVLIATPGRLVDHLESRNADLRSTEFLVLDEVDQMLDLGFVKAIRQIVSQLSQRRRNLFFSATMPKEIGKLAAELLTDPVQVSVAPVATTAERVRQRVLLVEPARKRDVLVELFEDAAMSRAIVFTRTKHGADKVAKHLELAGIATASIHGNKSQSERQRSLGAFRAGRVRALVATDIAARGIDVDGVTHVINFELPEVAESYVHRIGRTARAGAEGIAISLCGGDERGLLRNIERLTRQTIESEDRRINQEPWTASRPSNTSEGHRAGQPSRARPAGPRRPHSGGGSEERGGNASGQARRPQRHAAANAPVRRTTAHG
jgi:ATP-dependent RNA helicase RhlE